MSAAYLLLALLILAGMFGCGMLFGYQRGLIAHECEVVPIVATAPESHRLKLAEEAIRIRDDRIALLESVKVVEVSPWLTLPWQRVPSPARTFWVQGLVDEIQDLRTELADTKERLAHMDWVRARHWTALRNLRQRVKAMVPAVVAEVKADQFTRSLTVAKSAFGRAADLSTAITELDIARAESQSLDEFNTEFEQILERHQIGVMT